MQGFNRVLSSLTTLMIDPRLVKELIQISNGITNDLATNFAVGGSTSFKAPTLEALGGNAQILSGG